MTVNDVPLNDSTALSDDELVERGMGFALVARQIPDHLAIVSEAGNRSVGDLNRHANQLVRALRARGLKSGDGVALVSPNRPEFIESYYACLRAGLRITAVNWHQSDDDIAYVVDNCEAKALIACGGRFDSAIERAVNTSSHLVAKLGFGEPLPGFENYQSALDEQDGSDIPDPENGNIMLYTSGTTGRPKGVYRSRRPLSSPILDRVIETADFQPGRDRCLVTGPLYHAAPLGLNLALPLQKGVTCVLMDRWDAEETLRLIEAHRITFTHLVPTMFQRLLALPEEVKKKYDVSSLTYVLHGAAPCPVSIKQAAMDWLGPVIYEYYAATEGGGVFCTPEQWLRKPGTVGLPAEGLVMKIFDDEGNELPPGERGTIYFETGEVPFEYFKDPEKTRKSYRGRFYTMGDIGYVDEEGYLFLTGRSAELVICGGVNVYPAQIDNVLIRHPAIHDVAAVGVPNEEFGEEIKAVVELHEGYAPTEETAQSILDFGREQLTGFMRPRSVDFVERIPRSEGGKILRRQLREKYWH